VLKKGEKYRINGELNLSRAFGDRHLKHCMSSQPDLYRFPKSAHKRWVMATDGFYNASELKRRMSVAEVEELQQDGTVYLDNASVIFLNF
jgi:serine/threonine protein phosphatase PrpC